MLNEDVFAMMNKLRESKVPHDICMLNGLLVLNAHELLNEVIEHRSAARLVLMQIGGPAPDRRISVEKVTSVIRGVISTAEIAGNQRDLHRSLELRYVAYQQMKMLDELGLVTAEEGKYLRTEIDRISGYETAKQLIAAAPTRAGQPRPEPSEEAPAASQSSRGAEPPLATITHPAGVEEAARLLRDQKGSTYRVAYLKKVDGVWVDTEVKP